jgi:hypothetical protein
MSPRQSIVLILVVGLVGGCGAKSGLRVPPPPDAGVDTGVDAGPPDAGPPDAGPVPDECVELPYDEPPESVEVSFIGRILAADVLFLVDTTGSMTEEIDQISRTLREILVPQMAETIGDVRFSVASVADFYVEGAGYGGDRDVPFQLVQPSTDNVSAVQTAIERLPMSNGADGPESQTEALYQAATGNGIGRFVPPARCPEGTVGAPCFRADGSRIILLFTDAEFHNGPGGSNPYGTDVSPTPHTYAEAVNELRAIGAKVLGLFSGGSDPAALRDLQTVARDSGAVSPSGEPVVFDIGSDGRNLDTGVIDAVETLVDEVPIDIDVLVEDVEGDPFDATMFVEEVVALRAVPRDGAVNRGDRFDGVRPGTRVTFSILLQNDLLPPAMEARSYLMRIVLRGDRATRLQTTIVQIVIPGVRGETCEDF